MKWVKWVEMQEGQTKQKKTKQNKTLDKTLIYQCSERFILDI